MSFPWDTPTGRGLIDALRTEITDLTLRGVYADFLDEHYGHETPKSRLIRLSIEHPRRVFPTLAAEVYAEFVELHGLYWQDVPDHNRSPANWTGGFMTMVHANPNAWLGVGDRLLDAEPISTVMLSSVPPMELGRPEGSGTEFWVRPLRLCPGTVASLVRFVGDGNRWFDVTREQALALSNGLYYTLPPAPGLPHIFARRWPRVRSWMGGGYYFRP
jgi:uncharacterized protein (TIGR02996 family)